MNAFLSLVVSILSFGAVSDGLTDNAPAINSAIEYCALRGGGVVEVPAGETFLCGTLYLKSGVTLRLGKESILKGSSSLSDYSALCSIAPTESLLRYDSGIGSVNSNSASDPQWGLALIIGVGVHDCGIEGSGTIDGSALRNPLGEEGLRGPHTILIDGGTKLKFRDFRVCDSGNYAFLGYNLSDCSFSRLTLEGGWDGIHIRGGRKILIDSCRFSTGDDALAGGYWQDFTMKLCHVNTSCNGLRMIMPSKRVRILNCDFNGPGEHPHLTSGKTSSDAAVSIEPGAWGAAPGPLDDIFLRNVSVEGMLSPFSLTVGEDNPVGSVRIEGLKAQGITRMALSVKSWTDGFVRSVSLSDCDLGFAPVRDAPSPSWFSSHGTSLWPVFPSWGLYFRNVGTVSLRNVSLRYEGDLDERPAAVFDNVGKVRGEVYLPQTQAVENYAD